MKTTLFYVHDPMCSWCWAYRPVLGQIRAALKGQLTVVDILGGLAPDTDEPMPEEQQQAIQGYWRQIQQQVGSEFNFDFWRLNTPRRSTYPACRAVIAATQQGAGDAMNLAIQTAYYLRAMNPSDDEILATLADELGLDFDRFVNDLNAPATQERLAAQIQQARQMGADSFPSWVLVHQGRSHVISIDYSSAQNTLARIVDILKSSSTDHNNDR
ncbi:Uncharacterised protein [BD1-7 clade bacterium]|uniref:DSBA-like thioredoxin domain-containing protein n=1 Tax=BD1-7 clade bacterium TaxID=2029982 RepID=A0A5S9N9Y0_9GAMM|nr:Uncharacterised protein [BD1-7 clade bacterium]CAA0084913.1 Uncharacterised protein [BD1-7 clade bacterium]